jgi:hypothetical protein
MARFLGTVPAPNRQANGNFACYRKLRPLSLRIRERRWAGLAGTNTVVLKGQLFYLCSRYQTLACPRETAEPPSVDAHKQLGMIEFREPYRIGGVQRFGEKWGLSENNREMLPVRSPKLKFETATAIGLNCQRDCLENIRSWVSWRSERDSNVQYGSRSHARRPQRVLLTQC